MRCHACDTRTNGRTVENRAVFSLTWIRKNDYTRDASYMKTPVTDFVTPRPLSDNLSHWQITGIHVPHPWIPSSSFRLTRDLASLGTIVRWGFKDINTTKHMLGSWGHCAFYTTLLEACTDWNLNKIDRCLLLLFKSLPQPNNRLIQRKSFVLLSTTGGVSLLGFESWNVEKTDTF